ncbi:hypothetical protein [Vibrio sp. HN007]|uniref:hypothetical protein n=1 Tax=Vibrio iocasae TaxID=3098914 RepID=UPI0035D3E91B
MKLLFKFFFISIFYVTPAYTHEVIESPELQEAMGCKSMSLSKSGEFCLKSIVFEKAYKLAFFNFDLYLDIDTEDLKDIGDVSLVLITQVSTMVNELSAERYGIEPLLLKWVKSPLYESKDIVVVFDIVNKNKKYTSYFFPRKADNGKILFFNEILVGEMDVLTTFKGNCPEKDKELISESFCFK